MKKRNKKYNPQKLETLRNQGKANRSVPLTALTPAQVALKIRAKQIIKQNSFPDIKDHREGCEFAGWMEISMASRPAEWRVNRMRFYGDWCGEKNLDKILPEIHDESNSNRKFEIDCYMTAIDGSEFQAETHKIFNPKNLDDLNAKVKAYISEVVDLNLFNLDECYAEIRA